MKIFINVPQTAVKMKIVLMILFSVWANLSEYDLSSSTMKGKNPKTSELFIVIMIDFVIFQSETLEKDFATFIWAFHLQNELISGTYEIRNVQLKRSLIKMVI